MSTRRAVEELWDALCSLREPLIALSVTVWEDRPEDHESMLADRLGDVVVEACGWLEEAIGAVREARGTSQNVETLRDALASCGEQLDRFERGFWSDLASYDALDQVVGLGRERAAWHGWAAGVHRGVEESCAFVHAARAALLGCWRELTGEIWRPLVSVNTTSVGQQITPAGGSR
jgi:ribosome modulation factor